MPDKKKHALITGISGQDGFYLSVALLEAGYTVSGLTRGGPYSFSPGSLGIVSVTTTNYSKESLSKIIADIQPSFIFNLAGQSYVSRSWDLLSETLDSQGLLVGNILDAMIENSPQAKLVNLTSAEIFDHKQALPFNEESDCKPYNPYGCAQLLGQNLVDVYREGRGIWAANAILFPHESKRRSKGFLFPRILGGIRAIVERGSETLELGNLDVRRDWGFAPVFMEGIKLQAEYDNPENFCFCTGLDLSVRQLVDYAFEAVGLKSDNHLVVNNDYVRNYEPDISYGSSQKAMKLLAWDFKYTAYDVVDKLLKHNFE